MTKTLIVRYQTLPEAADENARLIEGVFAALADLAPVGFDYTAYRLSDGVSFVHVASLDDDANPLAGLPAFADFQRDLPGRCAAPPAPSDAIVVGSYR
ncbi:MAG: hypothetical protein WCP95_06620 [Actinomycetes bacterium]